MSSATDAVPAALSRDLIRRAFGPRYYERGLQYFRARHVALLDHDASRARGRVAGSARKPYTTEVALAQVLGEWHIRSRCSCPMGGACKHATALALAWLDKRVPVVPSAPIEPFVADPAAPLPPTIHPPSPWSEWAGRKAQRDAIRISRAETVLYLLALERDTLALRPVRARVLKSGRYGSLQQIRLDQKGIERIRALGSEDRTVLLAIDPGPGYVGGGVEDWLRFEGENETLLEAIAATGRARLDDANGATIKSGAAREIAVVWHVDEHGAQHAVARTQDGNAEVFGERWGWYLDTTRAELGRTIPGALEPSIEALRTMPPVLPEHVDQARAALAKRGLSGAVPSPREVPFSVRRVARPRAVLKLARAGWDHDPDRLRHGVDATLVFRYDDETIEPDDSREVRRVRRGERVELVVREPEFERKVAQVLRREGFNSSSYVPHGTHFVGQPRAWRRPHPLAGEGIATWLDGMVERVRPYGIAIETGDDFPLFLGVELGVPELELAPEGEDWFEARLGIEVDGERIDLIPVLLRALASPAAMGARGLRIALPDGRAALVPRERLDAMLALLAELEMRGDRHGVARVRLPAIEPPPDWRFVPGPRAQAFLDEIERFRGLAAVEVPDTFRAELRPYQSVALSWLDFLRRFRLGGVLADDMGLGKTVQVLAHLECERVAGRLDAPALVVCPTSVTPNWLAEAQRFTPALRTLLLSPGDRSEALATLGAHDLVITSYALMLRDIDALSRQHWSLAVFDEAQWLKNRTSLGYRAALKLDATMRLCMTGTPVENHLGELKAQFDLVMPGLLGDDRSFGERFRKPIERDHDAVAAASLRRRLRAFLLRRTKTDVATELPPRTLIAQPVELGSAQRDLYETIRVQMEKRVRDALAERGLARSHITVLDALLKLRQVCCDPRLVDLPSARKVQESAKREALMDLLPTLIEDGRAVLLFSQFTSMLDLIAADLEQRGQAYLRLDGSTRNRRVPVERFQRGEVPLLLVSLKAGGVGLNLTRADTVILYDPWWNPAAEAQAIDRAHRIGQDKPVFVYELNCTGTVEEKMLALKARKRAVADAVLAGGEAALQSFGAEDLLALFAPG